jgi:hypothetical protein
MKAEKHGRSIRHSDRSGEPLHHPKSAATTGVKARANF